MYSSSGGDARSAAASNARDSSSSMPPDHLSAWDRQAFGRDKFDRADRDRHAPGKKEWSSDRSSSGQSSHRSSSVLSANGNVPGPPNKRRAIARYGLGGENGRYGGAVGRSSDSSAIRGTASPIENGKVERDVNSLSGGPSPGYSGSPGTERPNKDVDGHHFRESCLSPPEGRLSSSSPRLDPASQPHGGQNTGEGVSSWDRERPKFPGNLSWDTPHQEKESRERMLGKPEILRRTGPLPKLDSGRDWSLGDRELVGRLDRYGSASAREHVTLDVLGSRKEHSRHDWRVRDRSLLSPFSSRIPTSSTNNSVKDTGALSVGSEVAGITRSPQHSSLESSSGLESVRDDAVLVSPRKRPRLAWGEGLAQYEKKKVEEVPALAKNCVDGINNDLDGSLQTDAAAEVECPVSSMQSGSLLVTSSTNSLPNADRDHGTALAEPSLNELHTEPSSELHDLIACSCEVIAAREECSDEKDAFPDGLPTCISEKLVPEEVSELLAQHYDQASTVSELSVQHYDQVSVMGAAENTSSLSKDLLMEELERVEFEIDVVEKELVKLESECGKEHASRTEDEPQILPAVESVMLPEITGLSSPSKSPSAQHEVATSSVCAIHLAIEGDELMERDAPDLEDHQQDLCETVKDVGQVACHVTEGVTTETVTRLTTGTVTETFISDSLQVDLSVADGNPDAEGLDLAPNVIVGGDIDPGADLVKKEDFVSHLLQTNWETAKCSFDSLSHLLPKCGSLGSGNLHDGGNIHGSPQEAVVWKNNAESHERNMKYLKSKVAEDQCFSRLTETVLAVKYRALRESWKQEHLGCGQRKERAKVGRHGDPEQRNCSVPPSLRTSARLRPATCSTIPDTVGEELQVIRKLWSEPLQIDCQRAHLRMPSMLLNDKERALHRFVTNNALVEDAVAVEQERKAINPWSLEERKIFLEKYSLFGKNFSKIASFLKHKTVADCVEFYYRNQKSEDFDKVRRRHQLKKRRDNSRSSGYLATTTSFSSRHREVNAAHVEGLTLVAEAAAAMSGQRDFSKVVRSANRMVERARQLPTESGSSDAPSKPVSDKSTVNDGSSLLRLSFVASSPCALSNTSLKACRDRSTSRQGSNSIVAVGKGSHGELQSGVKGARSVHARSFKGLSEEIDSQWTDSERELFTGAVAMFGKDFHNISLHIGSKSQGQCKAFFSKTRKRLGLDKLVERHKATSQAGMMNDAKLAVPSGDLKSLQNEEAVDVEPSDVHSKTLGAQVSESGHVKNPEQEARSGEKSPDGEGSSKSELRKLPEVQAVNTVPLEHNALGQSPVITGPKFLQTGTEVRLSDDALLNTRETCITVPSASNSAVKEEACAVDNESVPIVVSQDANSNEDAPADVVQSGFPEASLVCAETLQFKTEPGCIKMEPVAVPNTVQDTSNALPTCVPLAGPSAGVPVLSSSSLTANAVTRPALAKERSIKVTETKTRREPTSWTQEEKEKFVDIIKKHGKNWDRLRESLPAKSLTQIKTYFQNSKAKLGLAPEGPGSGGGRGGSSRKRKADDSDSSSNAGSGGQMVSQKVVLHADEGSLKVSPSVLGPTGALGSNIVGADALAYVFGRNSAQVLEDPMNAQVFHSIGLAQNSTASGMIPMFNATGFSTTSLRPVQQLFVHPSLKTQQLVNHQQPQPSLTPLVVVQPLQQQTTATGIHQVHQLQPQQAITRTHQDLSIPVVQHLHKQGTQQSQQANSQSLLQQQQQHLTEAVLQQKLQPQLIQRQQQQQQQQLQLTAQQVQHHLQQVLNHQQAQTHQQSSPQCVSQQPQGSSDQVVGHQQITGSQPKAPSLHHQQSGQFQSQFYQINSKSQALAQPQQTTQQQQLQQLQLQLQQHQLQFQRQQQQAHPQQQQAHPQQAQVPQLQKQIPGSPQLQQQQSFHLLFEQHQQQQLALLRGALQPQSTNSEVPKHSESDLQAPVKFQQVACEDSQLPVVSQASDQGTPKSQVNSEALVRSGDVKLFGQSLLVQPGSGSQQTGCKVSSTSSQVAPSAVASNSFSSAKSTLDGLSKGHGLLASPFVQGQVWQVMWPGAPVGSSSSGSTMASILQGSTTARSVEGESDSHGAQEVVARMTERLIREARDFEDGHISELNALARLQDGRSLSGVAPNLDNSILSDPASLQCILSAEVKRLDSDSKRCDQLAVSDRGIQLTKSRGPDLNPLSVTMPLGQLAASQGLPRVLDALVALDEWRLQQANTNCSRVTEEFLSQSWEALHRDPVSLVEAGKVNESLTQGHVGGPEVLQHLRDSVFYSQAHLMNLQPHTGIGGGAWGSSSMVSISDSQHVLTPPSTSFCSHNVPHNPSSSDEQGRVESRDLDASGSTVG